MPRLCYLIHPVPVSGCTICHSLSDPRYFDFWNRYAGPFLQPTGTSKINRPCLYRHPGVEKLDGCMVCQRWEADEAFRQRWEEYIFANDGKEVPCWHRGPLVPLSERSKLGLTLLKEWYPCKLGFGRAGYVCPCGGCNSRCVSYTLADSPDELD
jgi:hypothetical protein